MILKQSFLVHGLPFFHSKAISDMEGRVDGIRSVTCLHLVFDMSSLLPVKSATQVSSVQSTVHRE